MRFRAYPKIGGSVDAAGGGPWIATEKIHGANFVIGCAGDAVAFGKRKAWLAADDAFFGWQLVAPELAARVRELAAALGAAQVVAYGELFGGAYPHPDVPAVTGLAAVQTGVWYAPDLQWAVFDVLVATGDDDDGELLAASELAGLALLQPPVVARARSLGELERVTPVRAPTSVPALFGLPPIAGNIREGYVAKPDRRMAASARPIVKRKIPEFDDAKFDGAESWHPGHLDRAALVAWAARLVNPARVASARSKVGEERGAIVDEIVLDVAVDLATVFPAAYRALGPDDETAVMDAVRALAVAQVSSVR